MYLEDHGIKYIPSRRNNPQTNRKVERFWLEYDRYRWRFNNIHEFVIWYNSRIHGSLWLKMGETPEEAFRRKLSEECRVASAIKLFGKKMKNNIQIVGNNFRTTHILL